MSLGAMRISSAVIGRGDEKHDSGGIIIGISLATARASAEPQHLHPIDALNLSFLYCYVVDEIVYGRTDGSTAAV